MRKTIALRHVFGFRSDVNDNVHFLDVDHVLYTAGRNVIIHDIQQQTQEFIHRVDTDAPILSNPDISALAVSPNSKYVAVAERLKENSVISIFDLNTKKRKVILSAASANVVEECCEFVSLSFSRDGRFLLSLSKEGTDWTLASWLWKKGRVVQSGKISVDEGVKLYDASYCPSDQSLAVVTGKTVLAFLRAELSEFKRIPTTLGKKDYLCHTWVNEGSLLLIATNNAEILLFDQHEYKGMLEDVPNEHPICAIASFSKGFVCGCDFGVVHIFENTTGMDCYKHLLTFNISANSVRVNHLCLNANDLLICSLENNQSFLLNLSEVHLMKGDEINQFRPLTTSVHHSTITGLDICTRKPLIATCGIDKSVRLWDYNGKLIVLQKFFKQQPLSVALHPSGLILIVGFTDKIRVLTILMDDFRMCKEFLIKNCREVKYSNGGQYFAVVNGNVLQVFNSWTCENVANLRGHTAKIRSICWSLDDSTLISSGMDSTVFTWCIKDGTRDQEHSHEGCAYSNALVSSQDKIYAVGSDATLKEIEDSVVTKQVACGVTLTQIEITNSPQKFIYAGSDDGAIRTFDLPITGYFSHFQAHNGSITRMRISCDNALLFTVSEDGCVCVFDINESFDESKEEKGNNKEKFPLIEWEEELLVSKDKLEFGVAKIEELKQQVEESKLANEAELKSKEMDFQRKLKEVNESFKEKLQRREKDFEALQKERQETEEKYLKRISSLSEEQELELKKLEKHQQCKFEDEKVRFQEIKQKKQVAEMRWKENQILREDVYEEKLRNVQDEYQAKIAVCVEGCSETTKRIKELSQEYSETQQLIEEDVDKELDQIVIEGDMKIKTEKEITKQLRDENAILKPRFQGLKEDIQNNKEVIQQNLEEEQSLREAVNILQEDIQGLRKELRERDSTVLDKRVIALFKENKDIEKLNCTLDSKILELNKHIQPKQQETKKITQQIGEMQSELECYEKENAEYELKDKGLKQKLVGLQHELEKQKSQNKSIKKYIRCYQSDLQRVKNITDSKQLKEAMKSLYQTYCLEGEAFRQRNEKAMSKQRTIQLESDIHQVHQRQRAYLEKSVEGLQNKMKKDLQRQTKDKNRLIQENVILIEELTELKREIKVLENSKYQFSSQAVI